MLFWPKNNRLTNESAENGQIGPIEVEKIFYKISIIKIFGIIYFD